MLNFIRTLMVAVLSFVSIPAQSAVENFYDARQRLIEYYESGQYMREFATVTDEARAMLQQAIEHNKEQHRLAIVLDVDETAISNIKLIFAAYSLVFKVGDSVPESFFAPFKSPYNASALKPVLWLYQYAIKHDVSVFFVSARRCEGQAMTEKNLKAVGYAQWEDVILLGPQDANISSEAFKTRTRKEITQRGYDIVLTLGDQNSDINGPNTGQAFRVPNPFYYTP